MVRKLRSSTILALAPKLSITNSSLRLGGQISDGVEVIGEVRVGWSSCRLLVRQVN